MGHEQTHEEGWIVDNGTIRNESNGNEKSVELDSEARLILASIKNER